MAQGDRSAIHVDFAAIEAQFLLDREILRRKGLVHFDQIDVIQSQPCPLQARVLVAGTGPRPISLGSTPAIPQFTIRPSGLRLRFCAML